MGYQQAGYYQDCRLYCKRYSRRQKDEVQVVVHIVDTYITSVPTTYAEVVYQSTDVAAQLPVTVEAIYADKKTGNSVVTWNAKVAAIDTETIGTYKITGTIDGFDEAVERQKSSSIQDYSSI